MLFYLYCGLTCRWLKLTNQWSSQYAYLFMSGEFLKNTDRPISRRETSHMSRRSLARPEKLSNMKSNLGIMSAGIIDLLLL